MKPQTLQTRERIHQSQEKALGEILLAHEKEAWTPIQPFEVLLPTDEILARTCPSRYVVKVDAPIPLWRRLLRRIR